jgi:hypothetical protein
MNSTCMKQTISPEDKDCNWDETVMQEIVQIQAQ